MDRKTKKIVLTVVYGSIMFYALTGVMYLFANAVNLMSFKMIWGAGIDKSFYKHSRITCIVAVLISCVGLGLFVTDFFVKWKAVFEHIFLIAEAAVILSLIILSIVYNGKIPKDEGEAYASNFNLYNPIQVMYIKQIITFFLLLVIRIYKIFFNRKEEVLKSE